MKTQNRGWGGGGKKKPNTTTSSYCIVQQHCLQLVANVKGLVAKLYFCLVYLVLYFHDKEKQFLSAVMLKNFLTVLDQNGHFVFTFSED